MHFPRLSLPGCESLETPIFIPAKFLSQQERFADDEGVLSFASGSLFSALALEQSPSGGRPAYFPTRHRPLSFEEEAVMRSLQAPAQPPSTHLASGRRSALSREVDEVMSKESQAARACRKQRARHASPSESQASQALFDALSLDVQHAKSSCKVAGRRRKIAEGEQAQFPQHCRA